MEKEPVPVESEDEDAEYEQQTCWEKVWPQIFFLLFGIGNAVTTKFAVICEAEGLPKWGLHSFQKPWFLTTICFFAMMCALPIYVVHSIRERRKGNTSLMLVQELSFKAFCEFAIPAASDAFEGIVSAVCIVYVGVSIDSMMKSGTLVGCSLVSRWIFKQHYHTWQWIAITGVVISLTIVGASGIVASGSASTVKTSRGWVALIIVLKFISQVGYAIKISYEEYFVQKLHYHPIMICGVEGVWSFIMCGLICQPIAQFMPGEEGNGIREDTVDTFEMIKNNPSLIGLICFCWFLGITYNCVSTTLIGRTSAVIRTLMESFRTLLIWLTQFSIFYGLREAKDPAVNRFKMAGEEWSIGGYIQMGGFCLMTFSLFMYNGIPKYPCFNYGPIHFKKDEEYEPTIPKAGGGNDPERRLQIVSEIETNADGSQSIRAEESNDGQADSDGSVRSMSVGSSDGPDQL
jgi:hypothetical protein